MKIYKMITSPAFSLSTAAFFHAEAAYQHRALAAVSYTHLDVYKRQVMGLPPAKIAARSNTFCSSRTLPGQV